jgi:Na+/melibiose symporter-like transporter
MQRGYARLSIKTVRRNERRKLSAAWCNSAATGILTVGAFAPIIAAIIGFGQSPRDWTVSMTVVGAFVVSICLHLVGLRMPGGLEE